jgi:NADH-quinone oxidoreductase subunit J
VITVPQLFFAYFAIAMTVLSLLVITARNPVNSVLWMLALFFHIAGLYLFLNAEFLAAVQLILYAGAILVLFLFVIMMLNVKDEIIGKRFIKGWPIGIALVMSILVVIYFPISKLIQGPVGQYTIEAIKAETNSKVLGRVLYTDYLFPFEVASLILLIAIVGAMVLAKRRA